MKVEYMLPGLATAAIGFVILFGLLASVSALGKSKQFAAVRTLASGQAGSGKRRLFFVAVAALTVGTCGVFAGVAKSDAERSRACESTCVERGHTRGRIGPSSHPDPKRPVPACTCSGGTGGTLEIRVDELVF